MTCDNTATNLQLNQVLGSPSQQLGVSGPAKALTIPLFGGASTCVVQLYRNGQPCDLATNPCADGSVQFTLSSAGAGAISCGIVQSISGQNLTVPSGTTTTNCVQQAQFTQVNAGCGQSIVNGTQNATALGTCVAVVIDAQSILGACINSPTAGFCTAPSGSNFAGATITMTVQFVATPGSGGSAGGTQLGTNTFTVAAPEPGLLLVSASPQLIPSNGTAASVVSATFACGSGASSINGFPLSGAGATVPATFTTGSTTIVNQPIIGTGQNAVCGAGLLGTFQFTTPAGILFDNGTRSETVQCGVSGQLSPFGNGGSPPLGQGGPVPNALAPLVFTCTGAAVLAIGQVAGQEVPINVVYTAAGGGFTAVGSTAITVAPSQPPRISVSCRPNTIAAGNPGSVCTSQVRDANGQPLNGVTGANVTWTTSDPSGTSILPCTVSVPGSISVATVPLVAPQVSASTPCQTATAQVNGVNTSALFGLATAVLVTSPTVRPETVTVTATLGTQIPPSFACLVSPYLPSGFPSAATGAPLVSGCGSANPVGFTGLATALSPASASLGAAAVALPPAASASTTVTVGPLPGLVIGGPSISTAAASSSAPANSIPSANSANTAPASIPQAPSAPQFTLPPGTLPVASLNPAGGYTVTLTVCGTDAQNNPVAGEPLSLSFSAASGDPVGDTTVMTDATACFTGSVDIGGAGSALPGAGERYNLQRRIRAIHSSAGGGHTAALRSTSPRTACLERRWFIGWDGSSGHGCEQCSTGSHV